MPLNSSGSSPLLSPVSDVASESISSTSFPQFSSVQFSAAFTANTSFQSSNNAICSHRFNQAIETLLKKVFVFIFSLIFFFY
jgi:hypothetical protein